MKHYTVEMKEAIVQKALNRNGRSLKSIAEANNVGCSTLEKWLKTYREANSGSQKAGSHLYNNLTKEERFMILLETAQFGDQALGAYCREHGLYRFHLEEWKKEFMKDNPHDKQNQTQLETLRAENKRLEKMLSQKDRALAEATALLELKKKADLIWGAKKDD